MNNTVPGPNNVFACDSSYLVLDEVNNFFFHNQSSINYNVMHINCRSIPSNYVSLLSTLSPLKKSISAICVSETWLKAHNENLFQLPGYNFVSNSRPLKIGGGVGIYLDKAFRFNILHDVTIMSDTIECIFVELSLEKAKKSYNWLYLSPTQLKYF